MYKILFKIIVFAGALFLFGCSKQPEMPSDGRTTVFVSILPQAGLAKGIAGDLVNIRVLVDEGQSPHTYEPTARQVTALAEARALFTIGVPFETQLLKKIRALCPDLKIVDCREGITLLEMLHAGHDEACTHEHGEKDPHVWLSPGNAIIIAENMAKVLIELDPGNTAVYTQNLATLIAKLKALDASIAAALAPVKDRRFYVFHPAFGYFGDAYGLQQIPVEMEGKAPSPRQMVQLIEQAKADDVRIIFVQKQFPTDSANAIAEAINGSVIQLDPLAENYIQNMEQIAESVRQALTHE